MKSLSFSDRARISYNGKKLRPVEMGKPLAINSLDGRANPKGIPYLYLSSDDMTAIAEVRPFVGDKVTVGKFDFITPHTIIDLRNPILDSPFRFGDSLAHVLTYIGFLRMLAFELARPANPRGTALDYIPLQYLCESIKHYGYSGVIFKSAMGEGYNLTLFEDSGVKCTGTALYEVEKITLSSAKCA